MFSKAQRYIRLQQLLGGRRARRRFVEEVVRPQPGDRVLDVGCGPGDILDFLPDVDYLGLDIDASLIGWARRRYGARGRFACRRAQELEREADGPFDVILAAGLLHHLDDREADHLCRTAARLLVPGGRFCTLDGAYVPDQPRLVRLLLDLDRGKFVRTPAAYRALVDGSFAAVESRIEADYFHVPYTAFVMTCAAPADRSRVRADGDASTSATPTVESTRSAPGA